MIFIIKEWLKRILGGVTVKEHQMTVKAINSKSAELEAHKKFIESVYIYVGNYPAWKAQQEYREYLNEMGLPLDKNYSKLYPQKKESVDIYLGRIVDAFVTLNADGYFKCGSDAAWNELLSHARGDNFLTE